MAEKKTVSDAPMRVRSPLRSILKVTGFAADTASSLVSVILRLVGTVLLIVLITGILFSCIFAYYVKTCLTPDLDITLEDYQLSERTLPGNGSRVLPSGAISGASGSSMKTSPSIWSRL